MVVQVHHDKNVVWNRVAQVHRNVFYIQLNSNGEDSIPPSINVLQSWSKLIQNI